MANVHRHRKHGESIVRPYSGPVSRHYRQEAHGGVCIIDQCKCGASRSTNSNAGFLERGPWVSEGTNEEAMY